MNFLTSPTPPRLDEVSPTRNYQSLFSPKTEKKSQVKFNRPLVEPVDQES